MRGSLYVLCFPNLPCVQMNTHTHRQAAHTHCTDGVTSPSEIFDSDFSDGKRNGLIMGSVSHEK